MRTVWVDETQVDGDLREGSRVIANEALSEWCLRGDDGDEPIPAGTLLEVIETRAWGKAMVEEAPDLHDDTPHDAPGKYEPVVAIVNDLLMYDEIVEAARELADMGLFEIVEARG